MVTLILSRQARDSVPHLFDPRTTAGWLLLSNSNAKADTTAYNFTGTLANTVGTVNGTFTLDFVNARVPAFDLTTPVAVFSSANSSTATLFQYTPASVPIRTLCSCHSEMHLTLPS
jgi:hypothetical protein